MTHTIMEVLFGLEAMWPNGERIYSDKHESAEAGMLAALTAAAQVRERAAAQVRKDHEGKRLCTYGPPSERRRKWLLKFDDHDKGDMWFDDETEAHEKFRRCADAWTCTLFVTAHEGKRAEPTQLADDLQRRPIEPSECVYCPSVNHWPWDCPHQPEARKVAGAKLLEIAQWVRKVRSETAFPTSRQGEPSPPD